VHRAIFSERDAISVRATNAGTDAPVTFDGFAIDLP
jgi:hypothetical protein